MLEIINLPQVGESIVEGTIAKWLKHPGDTIKQYEPLVEVVTDKVTMEVPSPIEGTISKFLAEEGETVAVGSPILEIDVQNNSPAPPPPDPFALVPPELPPPPTKRMSTLFCASKIKVPEDVNLCTLYDTLL